MTAIIAAIQPYLERFGYPVLFLVIFIESFGVPAPGQTLLIAAALLAAGGNLHIAGVLVTAYLAAVIGDAIGWVIGARGGRRLILRYGKRFGLTRRRYRLLHLRFNRHGAWFVTFARFFDLLRQINGLLAGSADMPFLRFLLYNNLGAALWVGLWGLGAYFLGRGMKEVVGHYEVVVTWIMLVVAGIGLVTGLVWLARRLYRRRRGAVKEPTSGPN